MMLLRAYLNCDIIAPTLGPSHFENLAPPSRLFFHLSTRVSSVESPPRLTAYHILDRHLALALAE